MNVRATDEELAPERIRHFLKATEKLMADVGLEFRFPSYKCRAISTKHVICLLKFTFFVADGFLLRSTNS